MVLDPSRRLQSLHVPVGDGVRLAVDVWLPVERVAAGEAVVCLEDVGPDGSVTYLTEGCLRFLQRATAGPAEPAGLGVPRSFARADRFPVEPGENLDLVVELLPVSALLRSGHRIRIAIAGNDASCFSYHGAPGETFTLTLGESTRLDLPVLRR